jgi:hypothetical protein
MSTTDTRAKLAELFRRLTDPAVSDLEAVEACLWFRKLRLNAGDVSQALGAVAAPTSAAPVTAASAPAPASGDGPVWPFTRRHAGESIAHIARTDPDYLRYMLRQGLYDPLHGLVEAAMKAGGKTFPATQPKARQAKTATPSPSQTAQDDDPLDPNVRDVPF